jgi:hypothetical protein
MITAGAGHCLRLLATGLRSLSSTISCYFHAFVDLIQPVSQACLLKSSLYLALKTVIFYLIALFKPVISG